METLKPIKPFRGRIALLATACLIAQLKGGEPLGRSSLAQNEASRRGAAVEEAQVLLEKGDQAYTAGRYSEAVEAYSGARDLIPDAPLTAELKSAATERYAQASVEHARVLSRKGDVAAAKAAVDKVLAPNVAPENPGALNFRAQLDDPIRTNPALTAEHAKNVDSVRRGLYTAEGAYNLGKFEQSKSEYQKVLRTDPTNTAARRGLEEVEVAKSGYQKSANDHTRAEMLAEVDQAWELQVPPLDIEPTLTDTGGGLIGGDVISVSSKIDRIIIPRIALEQSSLEEALDFLRVKSAENDKLEVDPARKGVNFNVNLGASDSPEATRVRNARFDLRLTNVPLSQVLKYLTDQTQTSFTTDDFAVLITPAGSSSAELVTRTYRVPPDFISSMGTSSGGAAASDDPFAEAPKTTGLLPKRLGAQEALSQQGVAFPEGASATYLGATNTLRVTNTSANQDYIAQIVETIGRTEPVIVAVKVTMVKVEKSHLEELGFDWILEGYGFAKNKEATLSGGTQGNGDSLDDIQLPVGDSIRNPITSGNRSGDSAISNNSIDGLLKSQAGRQASARAPGVLGVHYLDDVNLHMLMRGLDQKKNVDMMAKPAVMTRSGQSSSIAIVREFMYATEYEPPELPNTVGNTSGGVTPVTPATPTAFEKKDVGITLEVLPVVDDQKQYINVTLNPVFSDFDGFVNYGSPINTTVQGALGPETVAVTDNAILMPIFSKQAVTTSVDVADGSTVVVGGLLAESIQNVEDQTPILGSIPIVGRLFQSKARKPSTTAIMFLVNVELLDPTGRPYRNR
ncbi:MAG: type II and III secretion system protein [Verrucomicrobiaceae bacterium]|nr:MAG: type II and III secretion system protein [Verrucomicrobiaceae bacterium]